MTTQNQSGFDDIDKRLQELALFKFNYFCTLTEVNKQKAIVCFERFKGKSFRQIANKIHLSKSMVFKISKKCPPPVDR